MSVWTIRMSETMFNLHRRDINKIDKDQMKLNEDKSNEAQIG